MTTPPPPPASAVDDAIRRRRTSLLVAPDRAVDRAVVAELIELATWAPNHKRTWPWRFTVLAGEARLRFGAALAEAAEAGGAPPEKVAKLPTKYARSPIVVMAWVAVDDDPVRAREDRDAVAAAVQTLLLGATARDLASYWASIPDLLVPAARAVAGVDDRHDLVGLVYLGHPTGIVATPPRPPAPTTWLDA
ncbi:MAG: nitroreductase family protein [Acidimicrobiales bacterium]